MAELIVEPEEVYHAQAGEYLSSHLLATFAKCPALYLDTVIGIYTRPDAAHYIIGRAVHCLVLEGLEAYNARYVANSPVNPRTDKPYGTTTKIYTEWAMEQKGAGLQPITTKQEILIRTMAESVFLHKEAMWLLDKALHRESVVRAKYCDINCQIRMDALGEDTGVVDLKTCDELSRLPWAAKNYGYYSQLAFYRAVLQTSECCPGFSDDVYLIAVEKQYPYCCGVWAVSKKNLDDAQEDNELYIEELKECRTSKVWPTRYEDIRTLEW